MNTIRTCESCRKELPADAPSGLCPQCLATVASAAPPPTPKGAGFSPPHPDTLRPLFPQLEILGLLGHGGMGAVYKARQRGLDRLVALKVLPPEISQEPGFAERFAREARALARLSHPNIVTVIDLGQSGPLYYFLMEFVDGVNLRQMLQSGHLSPRDALALVPQICEALEYAHGEGIIHRDIKPENILLDGKGRIKVADFGLSKLVAAAAPSAQLTQSNLVMGTLHYIAPEQFERPQAVDHRVDLYALGVIIYEMLTGELPLGRFELPSRKAAVDPRLDELVLRALERNPARRYQHAGEIRMELEGIAGIASKLSPEVSRKLGFEYRSKAALFGWPLLHVATGVEPLTGRKRSARGIIALGSAPVGVFAFGDFAVGVIACGIVGCGLISVSVIAVGVVAMGSVAIGLGMGMGVAAIGAVAAGSVALGYYSSGPIAWGVHVASHDPSAQAFFDNPKTHSLMQEVSLACIIAMPVFIAIGLVPKLMAVFAERRSRQARTKTGPG